MNCEQAQRRLSEYLDKSLDPASHRNIESHLAACSQCWAEAELLAECIRRIAALSEVEPPIGFAQRVIAHVKEIESKPSFWEGFLFPFKVNLPMQATALVLVGIIAVYILDPEPQTKRIAPSQQMFASTKTEQPPVTNQAPGRSEVTTADKPPSEPVQNPASPSAADQEAGTSAVVPSAQVDLERKRAAQVPQEPVSAAKPAPEFPLASRPAFSAGEQRESDAATTGMIQAPQKTKLKAPIPVVSEPKGFPLPARSAAPPARDVLGGPFGPSLLASEGHRIAVAPDVEIIVRRHPPPVNQESKESADPPAKSGGSLPPAPTARSIDRLLFNLRESTTPHAVSLAIPQDQYQRLKTDLLLIGTIESESRRVSRDIASAAATESQLRVLLIVLPSDDPGSAQTPGSNR
jgi:hypothetical protein